MPPKGPPPSRPDDVDDLDASLAEAEQGIGSDARRSQRLFSARVGAAVAQLRARRRIAEMQQPPDAPDDEGYDVPPPPPR